MVSLIYPHIMSRLKIFYRIHLVSVPMLYHSYCVRGFHRIVNGCVCEQLIGLTRVVHQVSWLSCCNKVAPASPGKCSG